MELKIIMLSEISQAQKDKYCMISLMCGQPRDTVLRAGLSAPTETQLRRWAELVRPKIPTVCVRGI